MPKISVIIPIYNGETYLRQCVKSIINQTYHDIEIIMVNNKSTDKTGEICEYFAAKDHRIRVIHREEHGWICDGRNDGLRAAKGEWISFVDADDWLSPDYYEQILKNIGDNMFDIFCQGGCICEYPNKCVPKYTGTGNFIYNDKDMIIELSKHIFVPIYKNNKNPINMSAPWDKFYRKNFLLSKKLFFDKNVMFADDSFFNIIAFNNAEKVGGTDYIGYHYRQVSNSVTHNYRPDWPNKIYEYLLKLDSYLKKENLYESLYDAKNFTTLRCFLNMLRGFYLNNQNHMTKKVIKKELAKWKNTNIYKDAICQKNNKYLTKNMKIIRWILKTNSLCFLKIVLYIERKKNV